MVVFPPSSLKVEAGCRGWMSGLDVEAGCRGWMIGSPPCPRTMPTRPPTRLATQWPTHNAHALATHGASMSRLRPYFVVLAVVVSIMLLNIMGSFFCAPSLQKKLPLCKVGLLSLYGAVVVSTGGAVLAAVCWLRLALAPLRRHSHPTTHARRRAGSRPRRVPSSHHSKPSHF